MIKLLISNYDKRNYLNFAEEENCHITAIDGLDAPDVEISSEVQAYTDGVLATATKIPGRTIQIALAIEGNPAEIRQKILKICVLKDIIDFTLFMQSGTYQFSGIVQNVSFARFENGETGFITAFCPDPYFYGDAISESKTVTNNGSIFISNTGIYPVGIVATLEMKSSATQITLTRKGRDSEETDAVLTIPGVFSAGDIVKISTVENDKYITLNGADITMNVPYQSEFFEVKPDIIDTVTTEIRFGFAPTNSGADAKITIKPRYSGV